MDRVVNYSDDGLQNSDDGLQNSDDGLQNSDDGLAKFNDGLNYSDGWLTDKIFCIGRGNRAPTGSGPT